MAKEKEFICFDNGKKLGAKAIINGEPALALYKNGKLEGHILRSDLVEQLFDPSKPSITINTENNIRSKT